MTHKRILIFAPYGSWVLHHQVDAIIGAALQLRGCHVTALVCDGIFECCPISGDPPSSKFCSQCAASGVRLFSGFGIPTVQLRSLLTPGDMQRAREWVVSIPGNQLSQATFDGSPLGDWVAIQMHGIFKRSDLDYTQNATVAVLRALLYNAALIHIAYLKFINSWRPDHIFCYSGMHAYYRTVFFLSRRHNLPVLVHERGTIDDSFMLLHNHTSIFNNTTLSVWEQFKDVPLRVEEAEKVKKMLLDRETGGNTNFVPCYQFKSDEKLIHQRLRIPPNAGIVGLFTSGDWEYSIMEKEFNSPSLFASQDEWVRTTAELFARRKDYLVVRHHPLGAGTPTFPPAKAFLARECKINLSLGPNVRVIMPGEKITSYALLWNADACLITYSTIGSEAIPRGVGTVSMAKMLHTPMGIRQVRTISDYSSAMDEAIDGTRSFSVQDLRLAFRYLYYISYKMNHRFHSFGIRDIYSPDIRFTDLSALKEGVDPALDHVCNYVLSGVPLLPPPDTACNSSSGPEGHFLQKEYDQIRDRRARLRPTVSNGVDWKESSLAVVRARQDGKFRSNHHALGKSVERSRHKNIARMEIPAPFDDTRMLLEALKDIGSTATAEILYIGADNVHVDESVFSESVDLLSQDENSEIDGILWGAWIADGEENFQDELFTGRRTIDSFNHLIAALPRMADPVHLLSFVVLRKASLCRLVEILLQHSNLSVCIYETLLAPRPQFRMHRTMNSLLVFYGPQASRQLVSEAKELLKEGKAEEALDLLEDVHRRKSPELDDEILNLRITAKAQLGRLVEARTACESALRQHPSHDAYKSKLSQLVQSTYGYESIASAVEKVEGYLSPGQEKFLFEKVMSLPADAVIIEVGGYLGRSTVAMAFACVGTRRHIFCIDTFFGNDGRMGRSENFMDVWKANLRQFDLLNFATPLPGYSHEILPQWGNRPKPYFVFLDGSHEYNDVLRDFELSYSVVKDGGWIALHDFEPGWPGPWRLWIESAIPLLVSHEYCSNLACGRKQPDRKFMHPRPGSFSYSRQWAHALARIAPQLSAAMCVSLGHKAPAGDNEKLLDESEEIIAHMPEVFAGTLRSMLTKDAQRDPYLHLWNGLTLEHKGSMDQATIEYQSALQGTGAKTSDRIKQRIQRLNDSSCKRSKSIAAKESSAPMPACSLGPHGFSQNSRSGSDKPVHATGLVEAADKLPKNASQAEPDQGNAPQYYNQSYFSWQKEIGRFGGLANLFKFSDYIEPGHSVVDFGCGGGFLLSHITCRQKLGVEINPHAREEAEKNGVRTVKSTEEIPESWADIIISNHALEHVPDPVLTLKQLLRAVRPGGRMVFVVPHQDVREAFNSRDINNHLYTWNPQTLGNLFKHAGAEVVSVDLIQHQWPPNYLEMHRRLGTESFHALCRKHAQQNGNYQIRVVAQKPSSNRPHELLGKNETPVILITYNRPGHTAHVLEALRKHGRRDLYIFSDGPKNPSDFQKVEDVRKLIKAIDWCRPVVVEQEENLGLARSITRAVDKVFENHERLILLEDDCVPQAYFFHFVEDCLERFQHHDRIFGVSGYTVQLPQTLLKEYPYDLYFFPRISSWGWATWRRAWRYHMPDLHQAWKKAVECGIDLCQGGDDIPYMLKEMSIGALKDVWTPNWVISVYLQHGYFIYPTRSHIENIGLDGSGVHCGATRRFVTSLSDVKPSRFPTDILIHEGIQACVRSYVDLKKNPPLCDRKSAGQLEVPHLKSQRGGDRGHTRTAAADEVVHRAERLLECGKADAAFEMLVEAKSLQKPREGLDLLRARCFMEKGKLMDAIEALREELRWFPQNQAARAMMDHLHVQASKPLGIDGYDNELRRVLEVIRPYTMLSAQRLFSLYRLARHVCENNVCGNFVECGVAAGGSSALLAWVIKRFSRHPRRLFAFDSFEGMPHPTANDKHQGIPAATGWGAGTCSAPETSVLEACRKIGAADVLTIVKGYFEKTLPSKRDWAGMIALLHMDGDWYESTKSILNHFYDRLADDAVIQVDDYGYWDGCRKAIHDFEAARSIRFDLKPIDKTGVWFVKPERFSLAGHLPSDIIQEFLQDDPVRYGIESQMSPNERFQLYYTIRKLLPPRFRLRRFIEIGSYAGASLYAICMAMQRLGSSYQGIAIEPAGLPAFKEVIRRLRDHVIHMPLYSPEAAVRLAKMFDPENLSDFVLIDGDHSYHGVCQDITGYYPLLAPGGIMMFHDYLPPLDDGNREIIYAHHAGTEPGIRQACQELIEDSYGLQPLDLPLIYPDDPTQTQAHLPIIPGVFSTIRAYRKPKEYRS